MELTAEEMDQAAGGRFQFQQNTGIQVTDDEDAGKQVSPEVREDAPKEAQDSYKHYIKQLEEMREYAKRKRIIA